MSDRYARVLVMTPSSAQLPLLWAKSNASGRPHSLIGHLLDTAAVAERIWDEYMAPHFKDQVDAAANGAGRQLFVLLAGWHDLGKATPVFQLKAPTDAAYLLEPVRRAQLPLPLSAKGKRWPHGDAGALIARQALAEAGVQGGDWVLPLVQGHHGTYQAAPRKPGLANIVAHGEQPWPHEQLHLARIVAERIGVEPTGLRLTPPSRGVQLALGGFVVMADWIASSDEFPGLGLVDETMPQARQRADAAWRRLGLIGGWDPAHLIGDASQIEGRFGFEPRAVQTLTVEAATKLSDSGLLVVEAPMGEGKTEAALAAAEVLAKRFGLTGITFAMPTQGTTDAMYQRVAAWARSVDAAVPVSLLHGKAMLNESWVQALKGVQVNEIHEDDYGLDDEYGWSEPRVRTSAVPAQWLLGRHRGLLSPISVCTVDQVLWAATRTKFVALRHAGLSGRVLVIDEVHSYDAYMSVFFDELLRWCGRMRIPVVLMSATLAPSVRDRLIRCWRRGAGLEELDGPIEVAGYPSIVSADGQGGIQVATTTPRGPELTVGVDILDSAAVDQTHEIAAAVADEVAEGGCALVIMNTVARAQAVWREVRDAGLPCLLIHGQLTAAERARRTAQALDLLGPKGERPAKYVVVATQIAEQSLDVDADILFTDLAPIDLLLQRVGRLHRHQSRDRPFPLVEPRVRITGVDRTGKGWPAAFEYIYQRWALMRAANEVRSPVKWSIPSHVPELVKRTYESGWLGPADLAEAELEARRLAEKEMDARQNYALTWRLDVDPESERPDLNRLHNRSGTASEDDRPVVRDGDESLEVSLIKLVDGSYTTLNGRPLGSDGMRAADPELAREVLADSVRLRWRDDLVGVTPLPAWVGLPLLGGMPVVVLDSAGHGKAGSRTVQYDMEEGLTVR